MVLRPHTTRTRLPVYASRLVPVVAAAFALSIYYLTVAPDLTWAYGSGDGGELITAATTLGVPHPPGYPTYVLLGNVVARLPLGTVAYRLNLFSALATAAAVGFTAATGQHLTLGDVRTDGAAAALAAALTLAFMPLVWQQALVAEVYALNLLVVSILLWALLARKSVVLAGLLWGLSVTTHLTSLLLLPLVAGLTPARQWLRLGAAALLGLAPLLTLPLLAAGNSPVVWGNPRGLEGWWWLVSARLYRPNLFAIPVEALGVRLITWMRLLVRQFLIAGLFLLRWAPRRRDTVLLALSALLYLFFAVGYRPADAESLLLPALLCTTLLLVAGFRRVGKVALLLPIALLLLNFNSLDLSDTREVRARAEQLLAAAPSEAILLTEGDKTTFTLWYFHVVEQQRPDVVIVDKNLYGFAWYRHRLARHYSWLPAPAEYDLDVLTTLERPLCRTRLEVAESNLDC